MLIPHTDFPVRPERHPGESLVGYIYRFYWENGHEVPRALCDTVRDLHTGDEPRDALRRIRATIGAANIPDSGLWVTRRLDTPPGELRAIKWRRFHYSPVRYCPACLKQSGFHPIHWTLPLVEACPFHQCALLSRCNICGKSLLWSTLRPGWHCRCGAALATAPSRPALAWAIRLAAVIVRAREVGLPASYGNGEVAPASVSGGYSLYDVYDALGRSHTLRCYFARRSRYERAPRWSSRPKASAHDTPGAWEERLLFAGPCVLERALRRLVRWNFRRQPTILVLRSDGPLAVAMEALGNLPRDVLTEKLHAHAEMFLDRLNAGITGRCDVYFHPRFCDIDRQPYLAALAQWWHALASRISVLEPEARLDRNGPRYDSCARADRDVEILNALLDAACRNENIDQYSKLTTRWHIPASLQRKLDPSEVLNEIGGYLGGLRTSELAFVLDLLVDAEGHYACQ